MADIDKLLAAIDVGPETRTADAKTDLNALQVLEGLAAVGDLRPAEQQELERLRSSAAVNQRAVDQTDATYRGALQGATFNQADEVYGLFGGDKEGSRAANAEAEANFPSEYRKGKTAGGIASGLGSAALTGPFVSGAKGALALSGRSALVGGGEGFLWGSGEGEGLEDKLSKGARAGVIGGVLGGAAPGIMHGANRTAMGIADMLGGSVNVGSKSRAERAIMDMLRKSGTTVDGAGDDVTRAIPQGQPEFRLMDTLGEAGRRKASGIVRAGGNGSEELGDFLRQRQLDQGDRVGGFVDDAFGTKGTTAAKIKAQLTGQRNEAANSAYDAARAGASPVDVRGALSVIDQRTGGMSGSNVAGDSIDGKMMQFRKRLAADPAPNGEVARELSDFERVLGVKQDIQDAIGVATREGRGNEARELTKLVKSLDEALETSSSGYRTANDGFREASRVIDSVDTGAQMARPSRAADNVATLQGMTPDQKDAARIGYGDAAMRKLEAATAPTANRAKAFSSTKVSTEADELAIDPHLFKERIGREDAMWLTQDKALGGSRTADNGQDIANSGMVADTARAVRDVAVGNPGSAVANVGSTLGRKLTGQNDATRQEIARLLLSSAPKKDMSRALRRQALGGKKDRTFEAIMRALGREYVPDYAGSK